jgi:hypothetical protein
MELWNVEHVVELAVVGFGQRLTPSLVRVSCAVIRMRSPSFRRSLEDGSTCSFSPIDRASSLLPLNAKDECRLMMRSPPHLRQTTGEFFREAIGEIFHVCGGAQVGERQHRDAGRTMGRHRGLSGRCGPEPESDQQRDDQAPGRRRVERCRNGAAQFQASQYRRRLAHVRHELIAASRDRGDEAMLGRGVSERRRNAKMHWLRLPSFDDRRRPHGFQQPGLVEHSPGWATM